MFKKGQKCYSEKNEKLKLGKKEKQKDEVCRKGFDVLFLETQKILDSNLKNNII